MFRSSPNTPQIDLFTATEKMLSGKSLNLYEDNYGWHNLFFEQVTSRIDESIFKQLYTKSTGSPNAPIRILVAMMVLKEGKGYSDRDLYEDCRFNLLTRKALGLINADDPIPTESTYYLFRKQVADYAKSTSEHLFDKVFTQLSKDQSIDFEISGKRIRMDSKLLGSNIAWMSRYELVHQSLAQCYKQFNDEMGGMEEKLQEELGKVAGERSEQVIYRLSSDEVKVRLHALGLLIDRFLAYLQQKSHDHEESYCILKGVFEQQFEVSSDHEIITREAKDISAQSIQSPHDPDADYRNKGDQQVKGYSANVTESCDDDDKPNLIAEVSVKGASASDTDFLQQGVAKAEEVFTGSTEAVHADGAYHCPDNQEFCDEKKIDLHLHAIQGHQGRYLLELNEAGTDIARIVDNQTSREVSFSTITSKTGEKKWRIRVNKNYRYFTLKDLQTAMIRKKVAQTPREVLQKRNNVEATIFQLSYHCSAAKTRYRGLVKTQMWADMRCLWINFVRIKNYLIDKDGERASHSVDKALKATHGSILNSFWEFWSVFQGMFDRMIARHFNTVTYYIK